MPFPRQGGPPEQSATWGLAYINETELRAVLFELDPTGSRATTKNRRPGLCVGGFATNSPSSPRAAARGGGGSGTQRKLGAGSEWMGLGGAGAAAVAWEGGQVRRRRRRTVTNEERENKREGPRRSRPRGTPARATHDETA